MKTRNISLIVGISLTGLLSLYCNNQYQEYNYEKKDLNEAREQSGRYAAVNIAHLRYYHQLDSKVFDFGKRKACKEYLERNKNILKEIYKE